MARLVQAMRSALFVAQPPSPALRAASRITIFV
jgi:hypothetical protein